MLIFEKQQHGENVILFKYIFMVLIAAAIVLIIPAQAETDDSLCANQYLEKTYKLSLKKHYQSQYAALLQQLASHPALTLNSEKIFTAFAACVKEYQKQKVDNAQAISVIVNENAESEPGSNSAISIGLGWGDQEIPVQNASLKKLPKTLHKVQKQLKLKGEMADLFWFLWTESTIAATENRFNYYVYADLMEYATFQNDGRSFAVGFRPRFEKDQMIVDHVKDKQLAHAGLIEGAVVQDISSDNFKASGKFSWWLQQLPFEYAITFDKQGQTQTLNAKSIPYTAKQFYGKFWGDIAYIRFNSFNARSSLNLSRFVRKIKPETKGVIVDVRFNGGGALSPSVPDFFLKPADEVLVYKHLDEEMVTIKGSVAYYDLPMVVLQNRFSASMSEILVAALKEQERATIIGERSFGKGVGQTLFPVKKEGMVAIVESRYFYPGGKSGWNETGIEPNITVKTSFSDLDKIAAEIFEDSIDFEKLATFDSALNKARELLTKK